jgi:hypothetical protein
LKEKTIIYNNAAERCMFLANLDVLEKHLWEDITILIRDYPDDVNINACLYHAK